MYKVSFTTTKVFKFPFLSLHHVWSFVFYGLSTLVTYLMPNPHYIYIYIYIYIYVYIYIIKYVWVGFVCFYAISTIVGLFNAKSSLYLLIKHIGFGLIGFYGILTIVGRWMPNPLHINMLNIHGLVWLGFMAYQPL